MNGDARPDGAPKRAPAKLTHRVAAALLLLFCAGHTVGSLLGQSPAPEADVVLEAMRTVRFDFHGVHRSFYELFVGHAHLVSVYLAVSAVVAWTLSSLEVELWSSIAPIAWGLAVAQVLTAVATWTHFFPGPAILTSLAALLLVAGNLRTALLARRSRAPRSPTRQNLTGT